MVWKRSHCSTSKGRLTSSITDLSMPGMDGLQVIQAIHQRQASLPAILLSGLVTRAAELAIGSVVSGTVTLLRKPVSTVALIEHANALLETTITKTTA